MKKSSEMLLEMLKVTRGRYDRQQVFNDFVAYCALKLSNRTDPVHLKERTEQETTIAQRYTDKEREQFMNVLKQLMDEIAQNVNLGEYTDLFGPVHQQLYPKSGSLKQDFTPPDVAQLVNAIVLQNAVLPDDGYFTCTDPTCGSGILCLKFAERLRRQGFNPCEELVIQAADLSSLCVHMTYLQLSLYGVPAVIVQGDTLTLKEYDRWYTPLYIWREWIWKEPMPFGDVRSQSDELLKMASEPWYALARQMEPLMAQKENCSNE